MSKKILLVLALALVAAAVYAAFAIGPGPGERALRALRSEGAFGVGDPAPDVGLVRLDGEGQVLLLDALGGKPLVLIFGSFT